MTDLLFGVNVSTSAAEGADPVADMSGAMQPLASRPKDGDQVLTVSASQNAAAPNFVRLYTLLPARC